MKQLLVFSSRFLICAVLVLGCGGSDAAHAAPELPDLVTDLARDAEQQPTTVPALLWTMASDAEFASTVLARAGKGHRALVDSLLSFAALTEPLARVQLPELDRIRDDKPRVEGRAPRWAEVQWQGVRLLRLLAPDPSVGRDVRLVRELDAAMNSVGSVPKPAAVNGAVLVLRDWWAERGEDPTLTHDPERIPDLSGWLQRLELLPDDPQVWRAPWMLADLDRDVVFRERILERLSADRHAHLAEELARTLTLLPDSLATLGIAEPLWDPKTHRVEGHATVDLWRLAIRMLEIITDEPVNGAHDETRRLAALLWWDQHRFEARFWRDPREAPTLAPYLEGLDVAESAGGQNAAVWARSLYIEPSAADLVLQRLDATHRGMTGEIITLLSLDRDGAHAAGFVMAVRRRSVIATPGSGATLTPIIWSDARRFVRRLLTALTSVDEPAGLDAPAADAFWQAWWEEHRDEPQWTRDGNSERGPR